VGDNHPLRTTCQTARLSLLLFGMPFFNRATVLAGTPIVEVAGLVHLLFELEHRAPERVPHQQKTYAAITTDAPAPAPGSYFEAGEESSRPPCATFSVAQKQDTTARTATYWSVLLDPHPACIFIQYHYMLCLRPMPIGIEIAPSPGPDA
jgi:hypothetical protein